MNSETVSQRIKTVQGLSKFIEEVNSNFRRFIDMTGWSKDGLKDRQVKVSA